MATKTIARAQRQVAASVAANGEAMRRGESDEQQVTDEEIARRAFEISLSGEGGSDLDNWLRAEAELRRPV